MKYKIIASDMDGTMLNSEGVISARNIEAVEKFRSKGGIFIASTGRPQEAMDRISKSLRLDDYKLPMVYNMGAMLYETKTAKVLKTFGLERKSAIELLDEFMDFGLYCHICTDKGAYTDKIVERTRIYMDAVGMPIDEVGDLRLFARNTKENILKVLCFVDIRASDKICADCESRYKGIHFVRSTAPLLQLIRTPDFEPSMIECCSCDKGIGITEVAKMLNVDMSEVMAIGDSYNDVPMIRAAGLGVAMGNAEDDIKAIADAVTDTNDEDGFAKAVEKYALS